MKQQKIILGDRELTIQDLPTRNKLELASIMVKADLSMDVVGTSEYVLKHVVVVPQGIKVDDLSYAEVSALVQHCKAFLQLEASDVTITIVE